MPPYAAMNIIIIEAAGADIITRLYFEAPFATAMRHIIAVARFFAMVNAAR